MSKVTKDPLSIDKQTVEKYGITEDVEVPPMLKLSFLQAQLQEIMQMMWRSRVDVVHASRLIESENETLKQKGHQNMAEHLNAVQQSVGAIKMLKKLIEQIRKEYKLEAEE